MIILLTRLFVFQCIVKKECIYAKKYKCYNRFLSSLESVQSINEKMDYKLNGYNHQRGRIQPLLQRIILF